VANGHGGARRGSGRQSNRDEQQLQKVLKQAWPERDRIAATKVMVAKALGGDVEAYKLLAGYTWGKPVQRQEVAGEDGGPLRVVIEYVDEPPPSAEAASRPKSG
jgi:hypothetical protein